MENAKKQQRVGVRFEDPLDLYNRSEYTLCLFYLGDVDGAPDNYLLRQRCLLRLGRYGEMIQPGELSRIAQFPDRQRFDALVLLGAAYFRRDMRVPAENAFRDALELANKLSLSETDRGLLHYHDASRLWASHDFDAAERLFQKVLRVEALHANALVALSWIAAARGDLQSQLRYIDQALESTTEPYLVGNVLQAGTHLACELFDESRIVQYQKLANSLIWSTDMMLPEFYTFRSLGWAALLRGQNFDANSFFDHAMKTAMRSHPCQVMIGADRAFLAGIVGDRAARDRIAIEAYMRIDQVRWADVGAERTSLLNLAVLYAMADSPVPAEECFEKYRTIKTRIEPALAFGNGDERLRALELFAEGWVHYASNRVSESRTCFREAFTTWNQVGYSWRAVLVALALRRFGRYDELTNFVNHKTDTRFRHAWFARDIYEHRDRMCHPAISGLPKRLKEMVLLVLDGFSNDEIAEALELSPKSVRNRLTEVYARFDVKGRAKLRTKLKELGVR